MIFTEGRKNTVRKVIIFSIASSLYPEEKKEAITEHDVLFAPEYFQPAEQGIGASALRSNCFYVGPHSLGITLHCERKTKMKVHSEFWGLPPNS